MKYHDINAYLQYMEFFFKAIMQPSIKLSAFPVYILMSIEWLCPIIILSLDLDCSTLHAHFQIIASK